MGDIRNGMKTISGHEPTAAQIARVTSIAHDFDIPKNDALFPLFVALDQYHGVFSELPEKMRLAADAVAKEAAENTKHQVNLGLVAAIHKMGPQIGYALVDHAKALNQVDRAKWVGGAVVVVVAAFAAFGWITHATGYSSGFEVGQAAGHAAAADEKAMAAWANTQQGRMAYELAQAGNLEMLANCAGRGWKLSKGVCTPMPYTEGQEQFVMQWQVGPSAGGAPTRKLKMSWWDYLSKKFA